VGLKGLSLKATTQNSSTRLHILYP